MGTKASSERPSSRGTRAVGYVGSRAADALIAALVSALVTWTIEKALRSRNAR